MLVAFLLLHIWFAVLLLIIVNDYSVFFIMSGKHCFRDEMILIISDHSFQLSVSPPTTCNVVNLYL